MNEIMKQIDELFLDIKDSKTYKDYVNITRQMESNKDIMNLIKKIKRFQKIVVNENDKVVEKELDALNDKLYSYPLYQSYLIAKEDLQQSLVEIKIMFESYIGELLKIE